MKRKTLLTASLLAAACGHAAAAALCSGNCTLGNDVHVGSHGGGNGELFIGPGDSVVAPGLGAIGAFGPSSGSVVVDGPGARLATGGGTNSQFWVGHEGGIGSLLISNGALVSIDGFNNTPNFGDARFNLGRGGRGTATITSGGHLLVQDQGGWGLDDDIFVGQALTSNPARGVMDVNGGRVTLRGNASYLNVGRSGTTVAGTGLGEGELLVRAGGRVLIDGTSNEGGLVVGRGDNSIGIVRVEGAGSRLDLTGRYAALYIANAFSATSAQSTGTALLRVRDQGVVTASQTQPVTVQSVSLYVGLGLGAGIVQVEQGGLIDLAGGIRVSSRSGNYNQQSGRLQIDDSGVVNASFTFVGNGDASRISGVLAGTGTLNSPLTVLPGGMVAPGHSPGTLTVNGAVAFNGGSLSVEIGGLADGQHDLLLVNGGLSFAAGSAIELAFVGGFLPRAGDTLAVVQAQGIAGLNLATVRFSGVAPGFQFELSDQGGALQMLALNNAMPVPEPASALSLALGLAALWQARRRREAPGA